MKVARRTLITILSITLLCDLIFLLLANGSGHKIPTETTIKIVVIAVILILLIIIAYKYLRPKSNSSFEK